MNNFRQAAQAALEALEKPRIERSWFAQQGRVCSDGEIARALRAALDEPQPEPVLASVGALGHTMGCPYCQLGFTYVTQQPPPEPVAAYSPAGNGQIADPAGTAGLGA